MPSQYSGISGNVSGNMQPSVAIVTSGNSNPILLFVAAAHGLTTGDMVVVHGHAANVTANGVWVATVIDAFTLSIPVAGVAAGGATGTVQGLACGPRITQPSDGDARSAASVNPAFDGLADRTAFLELNTGAMKLTQFVQAFTNSDTTTNWQSTVGVVNAWVPNPPAVVWQVPGVLFHDIIDVSLSCTVQCTGVGAPTNFLCGILNAVQSPGSAVGSYTKLQGSNQVMIPDATHYYGIDLNGFVFSSTTEVNYYFGLGFYAIGGSGTSVIAVGDYTFKARVYRSTGVPQ